MKAEAFAPAKINLTLHVTGQRDDGYHLLDSLVVFAQIGDRLWCAPAASTRVDVTGPFSSGVPADHRNIVWRAADAIGKPLRIRLEKNLPHGAGLGGGSADAAAVLRWFGRPDLASELGADVPVCMSDAPKRMQGVGDLLCAPPAMPALDLVLVNPGIALATPEVFGALDKKSNTGMGSLPGWRDKAAFVDWLRGMRNDLQPAALTLAPQIGEVLEALSDAQVSRMSGSGATCFGVFQGPQDAARAAQEIASAHPGWWVRQTRSAGD